LNIFITSYYTAGNATICCSIAALCSGGGGVIEIAFPPMYSTIQLSFKLLKVYSFKSPGDAYESYKETLNGVARQNSRLASRQDYLTE